MEFATVTHCWWGIEDMSPLWRTITLFLCVYPSAVYAGDNCDQYDIRCIHGTCVDDSVTGPSTGMSSSNKTPKAVCQCDETWSGPACDVYSCKGRAL